MTQLDSTLLNIRQRDSDVSDVRYRSTVMSDGSTHPHRRSLRGLMTAEVVGQLYAARQQTSVRHAGVTPLIDHEQVQAFASLLLSEPVSHLLNAIKQRMESGPDVGSVLLDLLAPTARVLGDLWLEDRLTFLNATLACNTLQDLLRQLSRDFKAASLPVDYSVLLASVPGEQHTFGLSMLAAFFRRAGWTVVLEPCASQDALAARVASERFDAVGLSAGSTRSADQLPALVARLRQNMPSDVVVLAGGAAFQHQSHDRQHNGVDAVAADAPQAVRLAEALTDARRRASVEERTGLQPQALDLEATHALA